MTYLQALRLMVKAYKAAKGVMPKGIDLLKMKMRARQKAIDSNKVVQAADRFDKGNWFRLNKRSAREGFGKPKKVETEAEMLARMKRQNKESVARLKEKKDLGDKLKDLPDDIPDMADGGVASAIKKIKKRFGKKSITTGDKIKRPGNRQLFDDFKKRNKFNIGGNVRRNVTPQPRDPRLQNLIDVYESNPTLQSSMSVDDYLMQAYRPTTPTTEELATGITTQATQPAAINPIKPIIPIPESGDGGGITTIGRGRTASNQPNYMGGKEPGIVAALQRTVGDVTTAGKEIYNLLSPMQIAKRAKDAYDNMRAKRAAEIIEQIRREEEARLQAQLNRPRPQTGGGTIDSGNTGGYGGTGGEGPSAVGSSGMLGGGV